MDEGGEEQLRRHEIRVVGQEKPISTPHPPNNQHILTDMVKEDGTSMEHPDFTLQEQHHQGRLLTTLSLFDFIY